VPDELDRVCDLFAEIWQERPGERAMTPVVLRALAYADNYVSMALLDGKLVGACVGFFGLTQPDGEWELHSHIAGVTAAARGRSIGFALKLHQRAWALARGVQRVSWSFDPLIRRNAYFNLAKLGTGVRSYHAHFYGQMSDSINDGDESDRLIADWMLVDDRATRAAAGVPVLLDPQRLVHDGATVALSVGTHGDPEPGDASGHLLLVATPPDIEALRRSDKDLGIAWRVALREALGDQLARGARVVGFTGDGSYVLERKHG
jgi:predicted GNAT superfamily acetyltransferase